MHIKIDKFKAGIAQIKENSGNMFIVLENNFAVILGN